MTTRKGAARKRTETTYRPSVSTEVLGSAMRMLAEGYSTVAAGKHFRVKHQTMAAWRDSKEGRELLHAALKAREATLGESIEEARRGLKAGAPMAVNALLDAVTAGPMKDRIRAAATLLDRVGVPRVERVETSGTVSLDLTKLTVEQLRALREARKATKGSG